MKLNEFILKNDVKAENQTREKFKLFEEKNSSKRVLFLGNSITLHETAPHIGWMNNWGMSASKEENDYVHLVLKYMREKYGRVSYCIANVGEWEMNYFDESVISKFKGARDFNADTVIFRLGENIKKDCFDKFPLKKYLEKFSDYFTERAKTVIVTDTFWEHGYICGCLKTLAKEKGYIFVSISDLGYKDENKAIGLFEHAGVAGHPGDLGMQRIAERLIAKL